MLVVQKLSQHIHPSNIQKKLPTKRKIIKYYMIRVMFRFIFYLNVYEEHLTYLQECNSVYLNIKIINKTISMHI